MWRDPSSHREPVTSTDIELERPSSESMSEASLQDIPGVFHDPLVCVASLTEQRVGVSGVLRGTGGFCSGTGIFFQSQRRACLGELAVSSRGTPLDRWTIKPRLLQTDLHETNAAPRRPVDRSTSLGFPVDLPGRPAFGKCPPCRPAEDLAANKSLSNHSDTDSSEEGRLRATCGRMP